VHALRIVAIVRKRLLKRQQPRPTAKIGLTYNVGTTKAGIYYQKWAIDPETGARSCVHITIADGGIQL
jgi:hypothetical protein